MSTVSELESKIRQASWNYYNDPANSDIDDSVYDEWVRQLKEAKPDSPVFSEIGAPPSKDKVKHYKKMYSLDNAMNKEELYKFTSKLSLSDLYVLSIKLDGASAEAIYKNGKLYQCSTRGDGLYGEECPQLSGIVPHILGKAFTIAIYGEVVIPKSKFELVKDEYSNPRNLAAGSLMVKDDPNILIDRGAMFVAYDLETPQVDFEYYSEKLDFLEELGFHVVPRTTGVPTTLVAKEYELFLEARDTIYESLGPSDGAVVRLDSLFKSQALGYADKYPKFAIAWKFPSEQAEVIVRNIRWDVSKNGRLTPVAEFDPVRLEGADIENCTLHNGKMLFDNEVGKGAVILITRSGGVIPKFLKTIKGGYLPSWDEILCPSCGSQTAFDENGTYIICSSHNCSAQLSDQINSFFEKLEYKGFGERYCQAMVQYGVKSPGQVFKMAVWDYASILGFSEWHANMVYDTVQALKINTPYDRFLYALGIDMVGKRYAKKIAEEIPFNEFAQHIADNDFYLEHWYSRLTHIFYAGQTSSRIANSIMNKRKWILEILMTGFVPIELKKIALNALRFVITGTLSKPRAEFQKIIEETGNVYQSSVTKETGYLVAGEDTGKNKLAKAEKYGTKVINEQQFWEIINV